ncbi:hypothetical protein ACWIG4_12615 [Streptomyces sp. NPDC002248]
MASSASTCTQPLALPLPSHYKPTEADTDTEPVQDLHHGRNRVTKAPAFATKARHDARAPRLSARRPKQDGRHTPNLWPVWLVAPAALIVVGALAYGIYHGADALLTAEDTGKKPISAQDVIKTTVTVLTLIGAVLAALYAYRKQLLDEGASHRADATQLAERAADDPAPSTARTAATHVGGQPHRS